MLFLTYDYLCERFKYYNELYFNNELSEPTFVITTRKGFLGRFSIRRNNVFTKRDELTILISDYYIRPKHEIEQTLIHEMIHLWQYQNGYTDSHGKTFKEKASEINSKGNWEISRCSNVSSCHVKNSGKVSNFCVILFFDRLSKKQYAAKCVKSNEVHVKESLSKRNYSDIEVFYTSNKYFETYLKTTKNKLNGYLIEDKKKFIEEYLTI